LEFGVDRLLEVVNEELVDSEQSSHLVGILVRVLSENVTRVLWDITVFPS